MANFRLTDGKKIEFYAENQRGLPNAAMGATMAVSTTGVLFEGDFKVTGALESETLIINGVEFNGAETLTAIHTQTQAATVWNVTHNLNQHPQVTVVDADGELAFGTIAYTDADHLTLTFSAALSGTVYCSGALELGGAPILDSAAHAQIDHTGITGCGGSGSATTLESLTDASITEVAAGEVLKWNGSAWVNNTLAEAGIQASGSYADASHTHAFANLTTPPTTLAGYGITDAAGSGHNHALDTLNNVTITSNASGEILKWNGSAWVNNTLSEAGIQAAGSYLVSNAPTATTGSLTANSDEDGMVKIGADSSGEIELGKQGRAVAGTPFIDFHSSTNDTDYDVRIIASGGTASSGQGTLEVIADKIKLAGEIENDRLKVQRLGGRI